MCFDPIPTNAKPLDDQASMAVGQPATLAAAALPWFFLEAGILRQIRVNREFLSNSKLKPFIVADAATGQETHYAEVMVLGESAMAIGTKSRHLPGCDPETVQTAYLQTSAALAVK